MSYYYAELAISSPAMAETIDSTHIGMARHCVLVNLKFIIINNYHHHN